MLVVMKRSIGALVCSAVMLVANAPVGESLEQAGAMAGQKASATSFQRWVHDFSSPSKLDLAKMTPIEKARALAPCHRTSSILYCLGLGFRDSFPNYRRLLTSAQHGTFAPLGDKPFAAWLRERAAMSTKARGIAEDQELDDASASLEKELAVQAVLDQIDAGLPVGSMDGVLAATGRAAHSSNARKSDPDGSFKFIIPGYQTKQSESYWCGPATFQMIEWADDDTKQTQQHWADELGTTSSGTAITAMVSKTNSLTRWDNAAGTYVTQDVSEWDADDLWGVHVSHLDDGTPAPIIEHPELLTTYFTYLSHSGDGHFQVGRGFQQLAGSSLRSVAIFEPWNEADFYAGGNTTWGPQLVPASKLLNATKANSLNNLGL
jgi:hypothetical protein